MKVHTHALHMHIIVCLAKLMAQRRTLPTSQILTRMKLYMLILIDNLKTPAFSLLPVHPENPTKNDSPKEKCSLLTQYFPVYQKNTLPSSSEKFVTPYRSRSFFFFSFSLKPPPPSTFGSSMQFHASSSFRPPSFLYNLTHTPNTDLPMHIHPAIMESYPPPKSGRLIILKANLKALVCSHCVVTYFRVTVGFKKMEISFICCIMKGFGA